MLHASLYHRDYLARLAGEPAVRARRDPHRTLGPRVGATPPAGFVTLPAEVRLHVANERLGALGDDAVDALRRMGVAVTPAATYTLELDLREDAGFAVRADARGCRIVGADVAAAWAAWSQLELWWREHGQPVVQATEQGAPAWDVQIAPPGMGGNYVVPVLEAPYLDDDALRSIAHAGADGLFLYGEMRLYAHETSLPTLDCPQAPEYLAGLRALGERADRYGLRLYFCMITPKLSGDDPLFVEHPQARGTQLDDPRNDYYCLCSSYEPALAFHAEVARAVGAAVPNLGGLIAIVGGESYFHCYMRASTGTPRTTTCPRCRTREPEELVAELIERTAAGLTETAADAQVLAWPYQAHLCWSRDRAQLSFIDLLPEHAAFMTEIDVNAKWRAGDRTHVSWDYSLQYDRPSSKVVAQRLRARARGTDLAIKTESSWGIESLGLPYVGCLPRSARTWQAVRSLAPRTVLQRWGFTGMVDSVAERMGLLARWDDQFDELQACERLADTVAWWDRGAVLDAWYRLDDAVGCVPTMTFGPYYRGPNFLGPAHPLPVWTTGRAPEIFHGDMFYLQENRPSLTELSVVPRDDLTLATADVVLTWLDEREFFGRRDWEEPVQVGPEVFAGYVDAYLAAAAAAGEAHELLDSALAARPAGAAVDELVEQVDLADYLARSFASCAALLSWLQLTDRDGEDAARLVRSELANARGAVPILERSPWLSLHLRPDIAVAPTRELLAAKIALHETWLAARAAD